ncbi:MAG: 16S rRNA (cytidine(1402)-2'-O)-methyltransferase [Pseudomonadota bacterium]|nr:16S rRNA (cytidine(1402)-2'-O)-methyltransferase [Pseudomonadota bacterium]
MKLSDRTLYIVSTPIGNLDDITLRAVEILKKSDIILCEDTRRSLKLLNHLNIKKKLEPYHKFNEKKKLTMIIRYIKEGKILSLISDAGTPLLSDPGRLLINECIKEEIKVSPIPGASSITAAMSVSGFDDKFLFYGFLPKKDRELEGVLKNLSHYKFSQVFFIPALKISFYIKKIQKYFHDRKLIIAKEITKVHENFYRGEVKNFKTAKIPKKGEITLIISEKLSMSQKFDKSVIVNKAKKYLKKYSLRDTVELIMETESVNKKEIYQLCLDIKNDENS